MTGGARIAGTAGRLRAPLLYAALAFLQVFVLVRDRPAAGEWFLFGTDTIFHDAVVQIWLQQQFAAEPGTIPLWMPGLANGLPAVGAYLWTPLAPQALPFLAFAFPAAQKLAWALSLWIAGCAAHAMARAMRLRGMGAVACGAAWMLCGHVVTLIHAGHFQKVMALAWLPLAPAGALLVARARCGARFARGAGLLALGLGMMNLCGHPQIFYAGAGLAAGMLLTCAEGAWLRRAAWFAAGCAAGLLLSAAQLLPGAEMKAVSNRGGGVDFVEAVKTSYPPAELPEYVWARYKGSSVRGDTYAGAWGGERIVSDYFGPVGVLMALAGLALWRRRAAWAWAAAIAMSLLVGVGYHLPLYKALHRWLPGFDSFRSPGTFMCVASLGLAALCGAGAAALQRFATRRVAAAAALALVAVSSADMMRANRFFLFAMPWDQYRAEFLAPNELDLWLSDGTRALDTFDTVAVMSLRPLLFGGRAIQGYHPVQFRAVDDRARELGVGSPKWVRAFGFTHLLIGSTVDVRDLERVGEFPAQSRHAYRAYADGGHTTHSGGAAVAWRMRRANVQELDCDGPAGRLTIRDNAARGHRVLVNGSVVGEVPGVQLETSVDLPAGTHRVRIEYRPFAWALGLFGTALGAFAAALLAAVSRRRPARVFS